ncbi:unnamed protein product [Rotaria sordida]|uniref:Uncharacterized protein n=1 Tax=Rotaria sordida TaxID=392033 RepID=A0A815F9Z7_9BILA|nr:unnamed protein product [Rotaria sordida]CAF1326326.1 unnamed protein product [Rotaria sordida]CAF1572759.1 unnamed protein product [Rotaria sordida]
MVKRKLLHVGHQNKPFFETGRLSTVNTYLKYIPTPDDQQRFQDDLFSLYGVHYEDYVKQFQRAPLLPSACHLTNYDLQFLRQPQYSNIIDDEINHQFNESSDEISIVQQYVKRNKKEVAGGNLETENDQLKFNKNYLIQRSTTIDTNVPQCGTTKEDHASGIIEAMFPDDNILDTQSLLLSRNLDFHDDKNNSPSTAHKYKSASNDVDILGVGINCNNINALSSVNKDFDYDLTENSQSGETIESEKLKNIEITEQIEESSQEKINESEKVTIILQTANYRSIAGKILLIPSVILTKGLISLFIKVTANNINEALNYLLNKKLLIVDKYIQSERRQFEGYLKFVPDIIDDKTNKYLLQRNLIDVNVNVNSYLNSLRTLQYAFGTQCSTNLLVEKLQNAPYDQLNINLVPKYTFQNIQVDENASLSNQKSTIGDEMRKKMITNSQSSSQQPSSN